MALLHLLSSEKEQAQRRVDETAVCWLLTRTLRDTTQTMVCVLYGRMRYEVPCAHSRFCIYPQGATKDNGRHIGILRDGLPFGLHLLDDRSKIPSETDLLRQRCFSNDLVVTVAIIHVRCGTALTLPPPGLIPGGLGFSGVSGGGAGALIQPCQMSRMQWNSQKAGRPRVSGIQEIAIESLIHLSKLAQKGVQVRTLW